MRIRAELLEPAQFAKAHEDGRSVAFDPDAALASTEERVIYT